MYDWTFRGLDAHSIIYAIFIKKTMFETFFLLYRTPDPFGKHYANRPIQIYWKFYKQKGKFTDKNSDIFHISAENIDCGYTLEPPRRGGSNEYPQSMVIFFSKIRKIMYTL